MAKRPPESRVPTEPLPDITAPAGFSDIEVERLLRMIKDWTATFEALASVPNEGYIKNIMVEGRDVAINPPEEFLIECGKRMSKKNDVYYDGNRMLMFHLNSLDNVFILTAAYFAYLNYRKKFRRNNGIYCAFRVAGDTCLLFMDGKEAFKYLNNSGEYESSNLGEPVDSNLSPRSIGGKRSKSRLSGRQRSRNPRGVETVPKQFGLFPSVAEALERAARAEGVSASRFLNELLKGDPRVLAHLSRDIK